MEKGKWRTNFLLGLLAVLLGLFIAFRIAQTKPQTLPKNQYLKLVAEVNNEPRISKSRQIIKVGDLAVFLDLYPKISVGDVIVIEGLVDGEGRMFEPKTETISRSGGFGAKLFIFREKLIGNIESILPAKEASLIAGMILGSDKLSSGFRDALIATGTIHVVVVSGQNLSMVAGMFMAMAAFLGRRLAIGLACLACIAYAILTGFDLPVVRAVIMVIAASLAIFTGREAFVLWILILSAGIILTVWPRALFDVSFQLTFAATLGISTLGQRLSRAQFKLGEGSSKFGVRDRSPSGLKNLLAGFFNLLIKNAAVATSAFLFTAPIIYYHFGRISPISPLVNMVVAEAVFPIMVLGFATILVSMIFMPAAVAVGYIAYIPALFFSTAVGLFAP